MKQKDNYAEMVSEYQNDRYATLGSIADKYNVCTNTVRKYLLKNGITIRKYPVKKEYITNLNAAIDYYVNNMESISDVEKKFSLGKGTLAKNLNGKARARNSHMYKPSKYKLNEDFFEVLDTEDKNYWFGFVLADGCIRYNGNRIPELTVELSDVDYLHLTKLKSALDSDSPIYFRHNRSSCSVTFRNMKLCNDLERKGCIPKKTWGGWLDIEVLTDIPAFLRGYCDGNGFIDRKRLRIIYKTGSYKIAESLTILTQKYDSKIRVEKSCYSVTIENSQGFYQFLNDCYLGANVYLNRKMLTALLRLEAHYGQTLSEDHRKIMRNIAGTITREPEHEGVTNN